MAFNTLLLTVTRNRGFSPLLNRSLLEGQEELLFRHDLVRSLYGLDILGRRLLLWDYRLCQPPVKQTELLDIFPKLLNLRGFDHNPASLSN